MPTIDPKKARDEAMAEDASWFERYPHRRYRIREAKPFEFGGPFEPSVGQRRHVIVQRSEVAEHIRRQVLVPFLSPVVDENDDAAIEKLLQTSQST